MRQVRAARWQPKNNVGPGLCKVKVALAQYTARAMFDKPSLRQIASTSQVIDVDYAFY